MIEEISFAASCICCNRFRWPACGGDGGETSPTSQTEATTPSQGNSSGEKTVYADDSGSAAISDFLLGQFPKLTQKFAGFL